MVEGTTAPYNFSEADLVASAEMYRRNMAEGGLD
jgi:hypothetical protein